jgi:hypothetical protein
MAQTSPTAIKPTRSILEAADEAYQTGTTVGTSAVPVPAVVRSGRKAITMQNHHSSAYVYWAAPMPDDLINDIDLANTRSPRIKYKWLESGSGTNEWYAVLNDGSDSDPSLSTPVYLYSIKGITETSRSEGTVGVLSENEWDYGDNDSLGFNTIYYRPPAGARPSYYHKLQSYDRMPTTSGAQAGHKLGPDDAIDMNLTANARVFVISDTASTLVSSIEFV